MKKLLPERLTCFRNKILVIDDEPELGWIFSKILNHNSYEIISSQTGEDGLAQVRRLRPNLVFLDLKLPDGDGLKLVKEIKDIDSGAMVIVITAYETIETAVQAIKLGAYDYISKPIPNERLKIIVDRALETQRLSRQVEFLTKGGRALKEIIGESPPMQKLFKLVKSASSYDISVILNGESGTGKELIARAIHSLSRRKDKPFIPVDCAILPETLVESELFGYEKGAFTGADTLKIGRFEQAQGGTIFLDEIANLTTHIQVKLLRVLQERKIERLGGRKPLSIDVQIITATNRNLEEAVRKGEFRDDLYHRLNVFGITLPPLRERGEDIVILSHYFLEKFNKEMKKKVKGFSEETLNLFKRYLWPGNVRELENTIKSSLILAEDKIFPSHLPFQIQHLTNCQVLSSATLREFANLNEASVSRVSLKEVKKNIVEKAEKFLIEKTLKETNWNKRKTATLLDIDYKGLFNKIKKYELEKERGKHPDPSLN